MSFLAGLVALCVILGSARAKSWSIKLYGGTARIGSEEPSALFFVADGAAKERMQCRDSQRKKKAASESAHKVQRNMEKRL